MIHVIIDTNIYRQNPRLDSPEFKALSYLASKDCIQLHVPYFVEMEFSSFLEDVQLTKTNKAITTLSGILNYGGIGPQTAELEKFVEHLEENLQTIVSERKDSFINWLKNAGAEQYSLDEDETSKALDAYFHGKPPLKEPKVRKDIPDSFIFQTVLSLKNKYGDELHAVIHDKYLREACSAEGVECHIELSDFLGLPAIREYLEVGVIEDNLERVSGVVSRFAEEEKDSVLSKIERFLISDGFGMISGDNIPGEANEIYVSGVYTPHSLDYIGDIEYFGDGLFVVHFTALVELTYEYAVYRTEVYDLDTDKFCIEPLNDHYVNVETTDEFCFSGRLELEFDADVDQIENIDELVQSLEKPTITISELEDFSINA